MARERTRRAKQAYLAGTDPSIPEIDDAAERYVMARDARMQMFKDEIAVKEELHGLMKAHKLKKYEYAGKIVEIVTSEETIKVRKKKAEKIEVNGDGEE